MELPYNCSTVCTISVSVFQLCVPWGVPPPSGGGTAEVTVLLGLLRRRSFLPPNVVEEAGLTVRGPLGPVLCQLTIIEPTLVVLPRDEDRHESVLVFLLRGIVPEDAEDGALRARASRIRFVEEVEEDGFASHQLLVVGNQRSVDNGLEFGRHWVVEPACFRSEGCGGFGIGCPCLGSTEGLLHGIEFFHDGFEGGGGGGVGARPGAWHGSILLGFIPSPCESWLGFSENPGNLRERGEQKNYTPRKLDGSGAKIRTSIHGLQRPTSGQLDDSRTSRRNCVLFHLWRLWFVAETIPYC